MKRILPFLFMSLAIFSACAGTLPESLIATGVASTVEAQAIPSATSTVQSELAGLCIVQAEDYLETIMVLFEQWQEIVISPTDMVADALSGQVLELQQISDEVGDLVPPHQCAGMLGVTLYAHTSSTIEAYQLHIDGAPESDVSTALDDATFWLQEFNKELDRIVEEAEKAIP